ncbi:hypothetical protein SAMN05421539_10159 [Jannaschia seohaensis]|uniref:Uncharacterized protein n=1 Tax=Jannaschia seohaensis TaxID=475081 RepID=A0A2Y9BVU2_9RHOB|nr:hypothetical protein BCF38_10159 [Jannaschia seohaensis]SSA37932.1 hypothetical protein SAMN05421539_10159 [Jannaschia seohaensis]
MGTDSFHGVVFAILCSKPFIAYGNPKRGIARVLSALKMFGLEVRLATRAADEAPLAEPAQGARGSEG